MNKQYHPDQRINALMRDYDQKSEAELDAEALATFFPPTLKAISLRLPPELIDRTKAVAEREGLRYQVLMRALIERGVEHLEHESPRAGRRKAS